MIVLAPGVRVHQNPRVTCTHDFFSSVRYGEDLQHAVDPQPEFAAMTERPKVGFTSYWKGGGERARRESHASVGCRLN